MTVYIRSLRECTDIGINQSFEGLLETKNLNFKKSNNKIYYRIESKSVTPKEIVIKGIYGENYKTLLKDI